MGGPRSRGVEPPLYLIPKRHLPHIQLFYQIFRYFVKNTLACISLFVHIFRVVFSTNGASRHLLDVFSVSCVVFRVHPRSLLVLWLLPQACLGAAPHALFAALAPNDTAANEQTLQQILPPVMLAVKAVTDPRTGMLPGWNITLIHRNSECSSTTGPLAAYELHKDAG